MTIPDKQQTPMNLINALSEKQGAFLFDQATPVKLKRSQSWFLAGNNKSGLCLLRKGRLYMGLASTNGNDRALAFVEPDESFGEETLFQEPTSSVYVRAVVDSDFIHVPQQRVFEAIDAWPELALSLFAISSMRINQLMEKLYSCCLRTAEQRVGDYLLSNHRPLSVNKSEGVLMLPASKNVIASTLNVSPETFSRQLHQLIEEGLIKVDRKTIHILDVPRMQNRFLSA